MYTRARSGFTTWTRSALDDVSFLFFFVCMYVCVFLPNFVLNGLRRYMLRFFFSPTSPLVQFACFCIFLTKNKEITLEFFRFLSCFFLDLYPTYRQRHPCPSDPYSPSIFCVFCILCTSRLDIYCSSLIKVGCSCSWICVYYVWVVGWMCLYVCVCVSCFTLLFDNWWFFCFFSRGIEGRNPKKKSA